MHALHVGGTKKLLNAALGNIKLWVQLSSVGAYGCCRHGFITEESKQEPTGEYERTKAESDELVQLSEIPHVVLRPSIVFGTGMPNNSLRQFTTAIETGNFFFIGKRGAIFNYVHVDDLARALIACGTTESAIGNTYIVSQSIQLEDMVSAILEGSGSKRTLRRIPEFPVRLLTLAIGWTGLFPLTSTRINALTGRCTYDSSKIRKQLGFKFETTVEERIKSFACKNKK
jgi:nucleoside-diphosphate-sugar epimerase